MRFVAIGDIGVRDGMIHIGDEAMFEQLLHEVRARGAHVVTAISANPVDTAKRYAVASIPNIGFDLPRSQMPDRMQRVLSAVEGDTLALDVDDPAFRVIRAIAASDCVMIAGGGNLSSLWPGHIFERATIGRIAALLTIPLVISGQTIGPDLSAADTPFVVDLLRSARRVGIREPGSYALSQRLGVTVTQTIDDASFLAFAPESTEDYCLVTLASHIAGADRESFVRSMASLLDHVAELTGLEIVFSPHFGSIEPGPGRGDSVMHQAVGALMSVGTREIAATDAATSARLARRASLVISSRYHPVVFAVAGGVPAVGIPVDDYTSTKLTGALANFGQSTVLSAEDLIGDRGMGVVDSLWATRYDVRSRSGPIAESNAAASAAWWDSVIDTFSG